MLSMRNWAVEVPVSTAEEPTPGSRLFGELFGGLTGRTSDVHRRVL